MRTFGIFLLCLAFGFASYTILDIWRFQKLSPLQRMQQMWEDDIEDMSGQKLLPKDWNQIREIELAGDAEAKAWLKSLQVPVRLNKVGSFRLEILVVPWNEEGKTGVLFQYDLIDLKKENRHTIWEKSRTLILDDQSAWIAKFFRHPPTQDPKAAPK